MSRGCYASVLFCSGGTFQNWQQGHGDTQLPSYTSKGGGQSEADAFA